ncbi:uncharacterized protein [Prorops nasuta]|uniref:uncharacterized protein n=1 Tax=Prorops nasuta TaxID=863751 RepID=UPI0034CF51D3
MGFKIVQLKKSNEHLEKLSPNSKNEKDNFRSVERLADEAQQHVQSLECLDVKLSPQIVVQIIEEILNKTTRMKWEETLKRDTFPSLEQLTEFLYKTAVSLSTLENDKMSISRYDQGPPAKIRKFENKTARTLFPGKKKCPACSDIDYHLLFKCKEFLNSTISQRNKIVKEAKVCKNCLRDHGESECKFVLDIVDEIKGQVRCRTLLDTCFTVNFITEELIRSLTSSKSACSLTIEAMNTLSTTSRHFTKLIIKSRHSDFKKSFIFFVVSKIADFSPVEMIPRNKINIPAHLKLADPDFDKPNSVDMLLGVGPTLSMFCNGQIITDQELIIQKTRLGWIIGGSLNIQRPNRVSTCLLTKVEFDLEKFWNIEEVNNGHYHWSDEELFCENHFKSHVKRNEEGRYIVALPFKSDKDKPGNSRSIALKRLMILKNKLKNNTNLRVKYSKVLKEYVGLEHMSLIVDLSSDSDGFYLPHHAVLKEASNTT